MKEKKNQAWVMRIFEREEDSVVTLFTDEGYVLHLRALGLNKNTSKNRMSLQLFSIVEIEFFQSTNLNSGKLKRAKLLIQNLAKNLNEYNLLQTIKHLIISYKKLNKKIYYTIEQIIKEGKFSHLNLTFLFYIMRLLVENENIYLNINGCCKCGSVNNIASFSFQEGGLLCKNCMEKYDKPFPENFLKKIIALHQAENHQDVSTLIFGAKEEKVLKELYFTFLTSTFGIYIDSFTNF